MKPVTRRHFFFPGGTAMTTAQAAQQRADISTRMKVNKTSAVRRIGREHKRYSFSAAHDPVLTIQPGDTVIVETDDARSGTVRTRADLLDKPHPEGANPVTGPIRIDGAQ